MKLFASVGLLLLSSAFCLNGFAQKTKLKEGDLKALKGQSSVSIDFNYDNIAVGKFSKEEDYVNKKKEDYNKKEAGRGDKWEKAWKDDRESRFEPSFIGLFEKSGDLKVKAGEKYTLIVKTTFIEPGYNTGLGSFGRKNAEVSVEVWLVETSDKSKPLAIITIDNAPGRTYGGYDFDTGARIAEAYELAGKTLGKFISKAM